jgi:hypothetical protein
MKLRIFSFVALIFASNFYCAPVESETEISLAKREASDDLLEPIKTTELEKRQYGGYYGGGYSGGYAGGMIPGGLGLDGMGYGGIPYGGIGYGGYADYGLSPFTTQGGGILTSGDVIQTMHGPVLRTIAKRPRPVAPAIAPAIAPAHGVVAATSAGPIPLSSGFRNLPATHYGTLLAAITLAMFLA